MPSLVPFWWFLLFLYFLKFLQMYIVFIIRNPLLMREDIVLTRAFYIIKSPIHLKNTLSYTMFPYNQDEFSGNVLREKKEHIKSFFSLKHFRLVQKFQKIGQFKPISNSRVQSARACISGIRIIYQIKPLTEIHIVFHGR